MNVRRGLPGPRERNRRPKSAALRGGSPAVGARGAGGRRPGGRRSPADRSATAPARRGGCPVAAGRRQVPAVAAPVAAGASHRIFQWRPFLAPFHAVVHEIEIGSAVAVVMDALDRVHTTATSHRRVMVVEVMGRHAGWIALHGGIAGGADIILIPEIPFDFDKIASAVKAREAAGYLGTVVVVAEGARPKHGEQVKRDVEGGEFRLGGIGDIVAHEIAKRTGKETRCCVLGHLQRGGAPTTLDRILGTRFGVKAVQLANEGHFGSMVSYQNYQVRQVPIAEAVNRLKLVPPNGEMVQTARDVDISFGD